MIPAEIRKRYGIKPGDEVHIVDYGGHLGIVPKLEDPVREARGSLAGFPGGSLTEALLRQRKREREREGKRIECWPRDGGSAGRR